MEKLWLQAFEGQDSLKWDCEEFFFSFSKEPLSLHQHQPTYSRAVFLFRVCILQSIRPLTFPQMGPSKVPAFKYRIQLRFPSNQRGRLSLRRISGCVTWKDADPEFTDTAKIFILFLNIKCFVSTDLKSSTWPVLSEQLRVQACQSCWVTSWHLNIVELQQSSSA